VVIDNKISRINLVPERQSSLVFMFN